MTEEEMRKVEGAEGRHPMEMIWAPVAVYADGGVIQKNPSPFGGTWAWVAVGPKGRRLAWGSGIIQGSRKRAISNNHAEYRAVVEALEWLPFRWTGRVCSDSEVTLGRIFGRWREEKVPVDLIRRKQVALRRLGDIEPVLLQGHPTRKELSEGKGKRGYPVSEHNVWCDAECSRIGLEYLEYLGEMEMEEKVE
jgi:ribonuclease HI